MAGSLGRGHWDGVYTSKAPETVSWYQASAEHSLRALDQLEAGPTKSIIDIGGGASTLADKLLERGWQDITVLDIAASALAATKTRLGDAARKVQWEVADITNWRPGRSYDLWHDRAVFHFLTETGQRDRYRRALREGLAADGRIIIATFASNGPETCSGLPVRRYDAGELAREFGPDYAVTDKWREHHVTPWGAVQPFTWCVLRPN